MATVDEIFADISAHQVEGMMFHDQMSDYFDFLGLMGFKRMHEYHFLEETIAMRGVHRYFINHFNMLMTEKDIDATSRIPLAWNGVMRQEVDAEAKKNAVKSSIESWVDWERETKKLYETSYIALCNLGEVAAAMKVKELVCDVDMEMKCADRLHLELKAVDYDMKYVCMIQDELHEKYKELEEHLEVTIC